MEMHLVHKSAQGAVAVVAVMFDQGAENSELNKLWATMPEKADQTAKIVTQMDLNALLPADKTYWRFSGSPDHAALLRGGVTWIVLKHPLTLSSAQLAKFSHAMHHDNNRPIQPLNGRVVIE